MKSAPDSMLFQVMERFGISLTSVVAGKLGQKF